MLIFFFWRHAYSVNLLLCNLENMIPERGSEKSNVQWAKRLGRECLLYFKFRNLLVFLGMQANKQMKPKHYETFLVENKLVRLVSATPPKGAWTSPIMKWWGWISWSLKLPQGSTACNSGNPSYAVERWCDMRCWLWGHPVELLRFNTFGADGGAAEMTALAYSACPGM